MAKIVVSENVTLEGVVQDPAGAEGFEAVAAKSVAVPTTSDRPGPGHEDPPGRGLENRCSIR
jgi:hypothetical protein